MMTKITVELPEETYSQLMMRLKDWNITLDELAEQYLKWVIAHPDDAILRLREQIEEEYTQVDVGVLVPASTLLALHTNFR